MIPEKVRKFAASDEHLAITDSICEFLKIPEEDYEKTPKVYHLTEDILRYNQTSETPVKELIKKWLDFLNEEEVNNLYQFLEENFLPKVRELWQEEDIIETEMEGVEETEETFEEKEKRYIELMKTIIQTPQFQKKEKTAEEKKEKIKEEKEVEEYKTITFEPKEEHKKETKEESLPETTIVITKKKEEKQPPEGEEFLDLSKL
jgi:hypothetical protein